MLNFRNSVLETIKTQKKMENPVEPTYSHEDAVARAFMASNLIANIFLGNEGGDDQVTTNQRQVFWSRDQYRPMRDQYLCHVICISQSEAII